MLSFSWIDNRTLIGCQILMDSVFALVFLGMKHTYPRLRGARTFALSFGGGVIGCCLMVARGHLSDIATVILANCILLSAYALIYRGTLRFFQDEERKTYPVWAAVVLATLLMIYYTVVDNRVAPRIIVYELALFVIRLLITIELFRQASGKLFLNIFASLMSLYTLFGVARIFLTLQHGSPSDFMQGSFIQTTSLVLNVIFVCIIGLSFLLMLSGELMAVLENQSFEDLVSGALNRRGIEQKLAIELGCARRSGMTPSIALIDIDHFKTINDTQGHPVGDAALRQVSTAISSNLRNYDFLGRYGGDEFLLILPNTSHQDALRVVERIENTIRSLKPLKSGLRITVSIGVTQAVPSESADPILARADAALYEAKRAGRNCCRVLAPPQSVEIPAPVTCLPT